MLFQNVPRRLANGHPYHPAAFSAAVGALLRLHYSTAADIGGGRSTHSLVNYLVNVVGFSEQEAISATSRINSSKPPKKDPEFVVSVLRDMGLDQTQIKKIISSIPKILYSDAENILRPKIRAIQELGLSGSELAGVIIDNQSILARGLETYVKPTIEYLRQVLGDDASVVKAIQKSAWVLSCNAPRTIAPNVLLLRENGFSNENIARLFCRNPRYMMQRPDWLVDIIERVENVFGISRESKMFFHGVDALAKLKKSTLDAKFEIFKSFGWEDSDIVTMVRRLPYCLARSETSMKKVLNFYMKELGYTAVFLANHPKLLMHSLEKRAWPRNEILKVLSEKKLRKRVPSLYTAMCLTETEFAGEYVLPYEDKIPDHCQSYFKSIAK